MESILQQFNFVNITWAIITPLILIILDVLSGVVIAWKNNDFKSSKMRTGLSKKFGEILYIIIGIVTKLALGTDIVLYFLVGYITLMEVSSLIENIDKLGVPIPDKIKSKINNNSEKEN